MENINIINELFDVYLLNIKEGEDDLAPHREINGYQVYFDSNALMDYVRNGRLTAIHYFSIEKEEFKYNCYREDTPDGEVVNRVIHGVETIDIEKRLLLLENEYSEFREIVKDIYQCFENVDDQVNGNVDKYNVNCEVIVKAFDDQKTTNESILKRLDSLERCYREEKDKKNVVIESRL